LTTALIGGLAAALVYVSTKLFVVRAENAELKSAVTLLKRRIKLGAR
jgi:hypothetical protein